MQVRQLRVEAHLGRDTGGGFTKWFEPADTVPDLKTTSVSVAVTDRVALGGRSTLDSHVHVKRVQLEMTSGGSLPYVIGHERVLGNYYKNLNQTASRVEAGATPRIALASSKM